MMYYDFQDSEILLSLGSAQISQNTWPVVDQILTESFEIFNYSKIIYIQLETIPCQTGGRLKKIFMTFFLLKAEKMVDKLYLDVFKNV